MRLLNNILRSSLLLLLLVLGTNPAQAATIYGHPIVGSYKAGETIPFKVYLSSSDQEANAISATVLYPPTSIEVVSISKTNSIVNLWVQEPSFNNSTGELSFEGVIFNPAYQGSQGEVLSVIFRTKTPGTSSINITNASVLANDGQGTNILTGVQGATYTIESILAPAIVQEETQTTQVEDQQSQPDTNLLPRKPDIQSHTHPDQNIWYSGIMGDFYWDITDEIESVAISIGRNPDSNPSINYSPPIDERSMIGLDNGVWYLHAKYKNEHGWGPVSRYTFRVDNEPPTEPDMIIFGSGDGENSIKISLAAEDQLSGMDHYQLTFNNDSFYRIELDEADRYQIDDLPDGVYTVSVNAIDKAGNSSAISTQITFEEGVVQKEGSVLVTTSLQRQDRPIDQSGSLWRNIFLAALVSFAVIEYLSVRYFAHRRNPFAVSKENFNAPLKRKKKRKK